MSGATLTFEALRDQLATLAVPAGEARKLIWVLPGRLGAAMTAIGAFEIFLVGPRVQAVSPLVTSNLVYDRWEPQAGGKAFEASRILLGSAAHFAAVAALIATELGRLDLTSDEGVQRSFSEVEPIIELAIRRAALSNQAILGLIGELHTLRAILIASDPQKRAIALLSWKGYAPGRDFLIGHHGIEVKATVGSLSRHAFSGIHQLEPQTLGDGGVEALHLLSLGLQVATEGGSSLPEVIDDLMSLLGDSSSARTTEQTQLLSMIASYGGTSAPSYDHDTMRGWSVYQQRYAITFARLYDVSDPDMRLLHRNLVEQTYADPDSLTFELTIPSIVSAYNPAEDWQKQIAAMAR